ncbi:hypothetical protein OR1_00494 [Geobacter sp. OR-1]|uniref:hypothetical protein n=1 Tax=Geobacter sp. OR-1 TaxID=1266765 RepID=UPI000543EEF7|nr:hypothetical protein [Geobacter sp. OR-1]GAM08223.1 hypothetical protein OR1_00494 [Geobacter sp. OR-1]
MSRRSVVIVTILSALGSAIYNLQQMSTSTPGINVAASPPALEVATRLRVAPASKGVLASPDLWNLKPSGAMGALPSLKEMFKPFYTMNSNGRFESLRRSDRPNERWEFQGVLTRGESRRAIFYNTGLKKLKILGQGDQVDEELYVRAITPASVRLEARTEKKPITFDLRILYANRDQYAGKKKIK